MLATPGMEDPAVLPATPVLPGVPLDVTIGDLVVSPGSTSDHDCARYACHVGSILTGSCPTGSPLPTR